MKDWHNWFYANQAILTKDPVFHAREIPDSLFLKGIDSLRKEHDRFPSAYWLQAWFAETDNREDAEYLFPFKVVLAKANRLIKRGFISECACGCSGFEIVSLVDWSQGK